MHNCFKMSISENVIPLTTSVPAEEFNHNKAIRQLIYEINMKVSSYTEKKKHTDFAIYSELRNSVYKKPYEEWSAQEISRRLNLSYGHFCASYKESFGISFHQDVIKSRISYAKYLLLTTSSSLSEIAY